MNKKKTLKIVLIISVIFFLLTSVLCINSYLDKNETPENILPQKEIEVNNEISDHNKIKELFSEDIDIKETQEKNNNQDIVGRLEIPSLFNILITQTKDNDYYLEHSITKKKNSKGTEYMDYRSHVNGKQINIYGHNSKTYNLPFRKLNKYLEEDFFNNNPYILFQHSEKSRIYKIIAVKEIFNDYEHMIVEYPSQNFKNHIDNLVKDSLYKRDIEYDNNSNIIVLQTCSYNKKNNKEGYYIIIGIEIPNNKE